MKNLFRWLLCLMITVPIMQSCDWFTQTNKEKLVGSWKMTKKTENGKTVSTPYEKLTFYKSGKALYENSYGQLDGTWTITNDVTVYISLGNEGAGLGDYKIQKLNSTTLVWTWGTVGNNWIEETFTKVTNSSSGLTGAPAR